MWSLVLASLLGQDVFVQITAPNSLLMWRTRFCHLVAVLQVPAVFVLSGVRLEHLSSLHHSIGYGQLQLQSACVTALVASSSWDFESAWFPNHHYRMPDTIWRLVNDCLQFSFYLTKSFLQLLQNLVHSWICSSLFLWYFCVLPAVLGECQSWFVCLPRP